MKYKLVITRGEPCERVSERYHLAIIARDLRFKKTLNFINYYTSYNLGTKPNFKKVRGASAIICVHAKLQRFLLQRNKEHRGKKKYWVE